MNTTEIKILLNKYYEGETSLAEEKLLKKYFSSGKVDPEFAEHIPVFSFHQSEANVKSAEITEDKVVEMLGQNKVVPFYKSRNFWIYFSGVAASLLFIATLLFETQLSTDSEDRFNNTTYSRADAEKAYEQTRTALAYVSKKYTDGTEPLGEISKFANSTVAASQLARFSNNLNSLNSNMAKVDDGVDNLSKLSKFTIIVKP